MKDNYNYCLECGTKLITKYVKDEGLIPYCESCNKLYFEKVDSAVLVILLNEKDEVCLLKQHDVNTHHVLIAGYITPGETLEGTVAREVLEEVGIKIKTCEYIKSYYYEKKDVLMFGFKAVTNNSKLMINKAEVDDALWVEKSKVLNYLRNGSIGRQLFKEYLK
ncbi:MAG: NUDIX domain-containing protein [Candidatus Izemoplasma sp.]